MRTIAYKITAMAVLLLCGMAALARQTATVVMKDGSKFTGDIVAQRPGKDITVEATRAVLAISEAEIRSRKEKRTKYEDLAREWKRWALEEDRLQGDAYGRYLVMSDITTAERTYNGVVKVSAGRYLQVEPTTYVLKWGDVSEITRTAPKAGEAFGVDDEVVTLTGDVYRGTIVSQKLGRTLAVKTGSSTVELPVGNILETRKVARSSSNTLMAQAGFTNTLVLENGDSKTGLITVQHYGTNADGQYVMLAGKGGGTEKVMAADVVEYRTAYADRRGGDYAPGKVYVNEFAISRAKTVSEGGVTAYVDKKVYPFPEGIVTTFKAVGAKFQGPWRLIALEGVEVGGISTQGYTDKTKASNSIPPSTTDLTGGVSSISFTYLSPGFYALVNDESPETYVIKIVK